MKLFSNKLTIIKFCLPIVFVILTFIVFIIHFKEQSKELLIHRFKITGLMATEIDLQIVANGNQSVDHIKDGLITELKRLEKVFSNYDKDSELSYVNQRAFYEDIAISSELYRVIETSLVYCSRSSGAFDITILPLVQLWNVTDKNNHNTPSQKEITETLKLVNCRNIRLREGKIRFLNENASIDLGGISKGYIIDRGIEYLKSHGIENALLNIGGDLYALGNKANKTKWQIGIKNPRMENNNDMTIAKISLENQALATSGDYERFRMSKEGIRLHHILDPRTGYPTNKTISVTILAPTAIQADVIATAVFILGPERGLAFIKSEKTVEGLILYEENGKISMTASSGLLDIINR